MADFDQELDACGLNCPLPILRAKKSLSSLETPASMPDRLHAQSHLKQNR